MIVKGSSLILGLSFYLIDSTLKHIFFLILVMTIDLLIIYTFVVKYILGGTGV
jgi:hypothetical protein